MAKKTNSLHKKIWDLFDIPTWLFILLATILILRIPSFFEPYSYGDETIYLTLGEAVRRGIPLYSGIHDNKPPLLYLIAALSGNLFTFKAILAFWSVLTTVAFWHLIRRLVPKSSTGVIAGTSLFALLTTIPLLEGNTANAELFMIGPTIVGLLAVLNLKSNFPHIFLAGICFSIASLFKVPALFDMGAVLVFWLIQKRKLEITSIKEVVRRGFILTLGFLTPIILSLAWYYFQGAFKEYLVAAFLQNVGYLSSWRPDDVQKPFIVKNLPLIIRFSVVFFGCLLMYFKRKSLSKEFILASSWLLFSLFGVTLSERPYPHYLVQSIAPTSILFALLVSRKNYEQVLSIIPLFLFVFVPFYYHFWLYPVLPYYQRFIMFASGRMSNEEYLESFGSQVNRYYKASKIIDRSTLPTDKVFVWGEGSQVYALSKRFPPGKYVADYHIRDFSSNQELLKTLSFDKPVLFVIFPETRELPSEISLFVEANYAKTISFDGVGVWKLVGPNLR